MPNDRVSATGYNFENDFSYTPVKVKDKDTGETFVIQMVNSKIKGNKAEWTVKDGKVYDANGKTIQDNILEVTKYQAQIIKAAAAAGDTSSPEKLNTYDIIGAGFADNAEKALQAAKSDYHITFADAFEGGQFYADVKNKQGNKGHLEITFLKDEPAPAKEQPQKFVWWNPSTWF